MQKLIEGKQEYLYEPQVKQILKQRILKDREILCNNKGSTYQGDTVIILNTYAQNNRTRKYVKQKLKNQKDEQMIPNYNQRL